MKKKRYGILTKKEFLLAVIIASLGLLFSSRFIILWLNTLSPLLGLLVYYVIMYGMFIALGHFGLIIFGIKIKHPLQTLGLLMITFALFIVINWESPYVNILTKGSMDNVSVIYSQSEDGAVWYLWNSIIGITNLAVLRLLTFVFTPFLLVIIGSLFVTRIEMK